MPPHRRSTLEVTGRAAAGQPATRCRRTCCRPLAASSAAVGRPLGRLVGPPAVLVPAAAPVARHRQVSRGHPALGQQVLAHTAHQPSLAVHERVHPPGRELRPRQRLQELVGPIGVGGGSQGRSQPTGPGQRLLAPRSSATSSEGQHAAPRPGIRSQAAPMAGSALSSPTSRCQSAAGSGRVGAARPEQPQHVTGRAAAAHGPASPVSPW